VIRGLLDLARRLTETFDKGIRDQAFGEVSSCCRRGAILTVLARAE
jgi:hypothetical protein